MEPEKEGIADVVVKLKPGWYVLSVEHDKTGKAFGTISKATTKELKLMRHPNGCCCKYHRGEWHTKSL